MKTNKYNALHTNAKKDVSRGENSKLRRSVTIADSLDKKLIQARAQLMLMIQRDMEYTPALNMFLEIGLDRYFSGQMTQQEMRTIIKYLSDESLKQEGRIDDLVEFLQKEILKLAQTRNFSNNTSSGFMRK